MPSLVGRARTGGPMSSGKGRILKFLGGLLLTQATVRDVIELGPAFRLVHAVGPAKSIAGWQPGDKIQVLLPSDDVRTYTPITWGEDGVFSLLVYVRDSSAASAWARGLARDQVLKFVGPQRSLKMPEGNIVLVGDETSIAVAAAYEAARPSQSTTILELGETVDVAAALAATGLSSAKLVRRTAGNSHDGALIDAVIAAKGTAATVGITGSGSLIQRVRAGIRTAGINDAKVKAYWIEGKVGLD